MGKHKEWRKIAKRERRRRVRTLQAKDRDSVLNPTIDDSLELREIEEIERTNLEEQKKWMEAEKMAMDQWQKLQEKKEMLRQARLEREARLRLEWELEQERKKKEEERLKEIEEENKRRQDIFMKSLDKFLSGVSVEPPPELLISRQTRPNSEPCPFFSKTACCRFGDHCSRNHKIPGISKLGHERLCHSRDSRLNLPQGSANSSLFLLKKEQDWDSYTHELLDMGRNGVLDTSKTPSIYKYKKVIILLATNFYSHFGLDNSNFNEYDTDLMLEYEENDTYREFKEFFNDVIPEFEKFGRIIQFKVCKNYERHLRGNTYIEFDELRCAVAAYQSLHSRWYGGKQLSLQFCIIQSWKNAICGLQSRKRCPKGRSCNFLHVFRNPSNLYNYYSDHNQDSERTRRTPPRSWRWSESPEVELPSRRRSKSPDRRRSKSPDRRRSKSPDRRRSKSPDRRHRRRESRRRRRDSKSEDSKDKNRRSHRSSRSSERRQDRS